ncbi:hypothetical protein BCR39DRAFT_520025 [Naematelia encephala]|uniref:Phospholipid/glycerol acyltransferase domain-containing protein n=1 Tax=Naematelia encephala TaxID=71784 RepID=A0A1Y2BF26_9TREE|nr:hypothetical protein BCR39DRAFT_520025 [Naematelia encephala]
MPFGVSHKPLVALANSAICSFFRSIEVHGSENVPEEGPIIFACSHANMAIDPAILSNTIPHGYSLHYWVKDSLFKNPAVGALLRNAGNIAVDRKNKNNQTLFRGTFQALALNECIGVFPEGTSHTEPHLIPLKDGTAWAALEYVRYLLGTEENAGPKDGKRAVIVPVGISYVDKAKYRSRVIATYGKAISMDNYVDEFLSEEEGKRKLAVKRLTRATEVALRQMTVNGPDWDTVYAAQMAREILWEREDDLKLTDHVEVSQTLVDLFSTSDPQINSLKSLLATYHRLLISSRLSNAALCDLPLPKNLDPNAKVSLPSRFSTLYILIKDSLVSLFHFPFFLIPMILHAPFYVIGIYGGRLVEDELETQAQMKVFLGLFFALFAYPFMFFVLWAIFAQYPMGAAIAAGVVYLLRRYHLSLIDENYTAMKRLVAAWRILIGVWTPKRFQMSLDAFMEAAATFAPDPPRVAGLPPQTPPEKYVRPKRLPSRVLVRNVLRTRLDAARELASVLYGIEARDAQVDASFWLAEAHGGEVLKVSKEDEDKLDWERPLPRGVRSGREVVQFLRDRGARLGGGVEKHWAVGSGGETEVEAE